MNKDREPPIAIHLGELIRNFSIVEKCAHLEMRISRDRLTQISTNAGYAAIEILSGMEFCTFISGLDNIDVDPSSSTCSLHETAGSVNQDPVIDIDGGIKRNVW